jgi:hypothetical protein
VKHSSPQPLYWYCSKCYTSNPTSFRVCGHCGTINSITPVRRPSSGVLTSVLIGGGGLLLMAVVCGFLSPIVRNSRYLSQPASNAIIPLASTPYPVQTKVPRPSPTPKGKKNEQTTPPPFSTNIYTSNSSSSSGPRRSYGPRQSGLIRGPRGGCYYINSRGNKTYVDRSLCNQY